MKQEFDLKFCIPETTDTITLNKIHSSIPSQEGKLQFPSAEGLGVDYHYNKPILLPNN